MTDRAAGYLSPQHLMRLHWACVPIVRSLRGAAIGAYLVGSAMTRPDYRDIDVRLVLDDDEFARLFCHRGDGFAWLRLVNVALSQQIEQASGLSPIDFQIQPLSHCQTYEGPRNPVGCGERAGGVDVPMALSNEEQTP